MKYLDLYIKSYACQSLSIIEVGMEGHFTNFIYLFIFARNQMKCLDLHRGIRLANPQPFMGVWVGWAFNSQNKTFIINVQICPEIYSVN